MQLGELRTVEAELDSLGYTLLALSADRVAELQPVREENELGYALYSDASLAAAKAFGLAWRMPDDMVTKYKDGYGIDLEAASGMDHHSLPVPAVFVVTADGQIGFSYVNPNHRVRLDVQLLVAAARGLVPQE